MSANNIGKYIICVNHLPILEGYEGFVHRTGDVYQIYEYSGGNYKCNNIKSTRGGSYPWGVSRKWIDNGWFVISDVPHLNINTIGEMEYTYKGVKI